jgi:hypothetical protein
MARFIGKFRAVLGSNLIPDSGTTSAEVGADALASGEGALVTGEVEVDVSDKGVVTLVRGTAKADAAATGENAFAYAETFGAADGADLVISRTHTSSGDGPDGAVSSSSTFLFALDIGSFDFGSGPIVLDMTSQSEAQIELLAIEGATATMQASAAAEGDATAVQAFSEATASVAEDGSMQADGSAYASILIA